MDRLKNILKIFISVLLPISLNLLLKTNLTKEIGIIFLILLLIQMLPITNIIKTISVVVIILTFYILIILNPLSFYTVWLQQVKTSIPQGRITNLILLIYFTAWIYLTININKKNILKNSLFLLIISLFILPLLFNFYFLIIYIPVIFILSFSLLNKNINLKLNFTMSAILISIYLFAIFNSSLQSSNGSKIVNKNSYNIRKFLVNKFPEIDILTSIPGEEGLSKSIGRTPILTNSRLFKISGEPGKRYYIRLKIESFDDTIDTVETLKEVNKLQSIKLTLLSDYMSFVPNTVGSKYNITTKIKTPLRKNSNIYLEINNNYISINPENNYLTPIITNSEIEKLALKLKGSSEISTINNIRNYLLTNYTYSTETESDYNYIENFLLQTKMGFCVHFTRSFIELARRNGINAREISGYTIKIPKERPTNNDLKYGETFITGKNTHLWPEVYIENKWITFDVTPGFYENEIEAVNMTSVSIPDQHIIKDEIQNEKFPTAIFYFLPLIFIQLLYLLYKRDPIKKLIKLGKKKGINNPENIGWVEWNNKLFNTSEYTKLFLNCSYNDKNLSKSDRLLLKELQKLIR